MALPSARVPASSFLNSLCCVFPLLCLSIRAFPQEIPFIAGTSKMRYSRRSKLTSATALSLALLICFNVYALRTSKTDASPSPFRPRPSNYTPSFTLHSSTTSKAPQLSPAELMARPISTSQSQMPKLFHQSWSTTSLPAKFEQWSLSCREMNPDFEWVLWTDEDNRRLVKKYAPQFLAKYDRLKSEIYRADAVRNLYMFVFGG